MVAQLWKASQTLALRQAFIKPQQLKGNQSLNFLKLAVHVF